MKQIAILGFGVVGSGVAEVLKINANGIAARCGEAIRVKAILDIRDFSSHPLAALFTKNFDDIVTLFDGEVDLSSGRYVVDAKSIMGIFSLDLLKPIEMTINSGDNPDELIEKIQKFIVK